MGRSGEDKQVGTCEQLVVGPGQRQRSTSLRGSSEGCVCEAWGQQVWQRVLLSSVGRVGTRVGVLPRGRGPGSQTGQEGLETHVRFF